MGGVHDQHVGVVRERREAAEPGQGLWVEFRLWIALDRQQRDRALDDSNHRAVAWCACGKIVEQAETAIGGPVLRRDLRLAWNEAPDVPCYHASGEIVDAAGRGRDDERDGASLIELLHRLRAGSLNDRKATEQRGGRVVKCHRGSPVPSAL